MIHTNFPEKLIVNGNSILDKMEIVNEFNNFTVKIDPKLSEKMQPSKYSFQSYESMNTKLSEQTLCEKGPYSEFFWPVFFRIRIEYGPEKPPIQTLFTL